MMNLGFCELISLAYQYGPFLFALLFSVGITRWGHGIYRQACARKNPPASEKEKETYRIYFISMAAFGSLLVVISIAWWFLYQPENHVFYGEIKGLKDYEGITSDSLFFKPVYLRQLERAAPQLRNEEFVIVRDKPFSAGETFEVLFSKGQGSQQQFSIPFTRESHPKYEIVWDDDDGEMVLRRLGGETEETEETEAVEFWFLGIPSAHAQPDVRRPDPRKEWREQQEVREIQVNQRKLLRYQAAPPQEMEPSSLEALQQERSSVGQKIAVLDQLLAETPDELAKRGQTASKEPLVLTLMDLTRHSDRELAFKARKLLKRLNPEQWLQTRVESDDETRQAQAREVLIRMPSHRAKQWLDQQKQPSPWLDETRAQIEQQGTMPLVPTGSVYGDRYYLQVTWPTDGAKVESCVTQALEQRDPFKTAESQGSNQRILFGYSKQWAVSTATQLRQCGAEVAFKGF